MSQYKDLIMEFRNVFTWSYLDLRGILAHIVEHHISLFPSTISIRQKETHDESKIVTYSKSRIGATFQVGFIKPIEIIGWMSPMVLIKKKNGKFHICIDYRALNKYTCKDHFPLPFMNTILDEVARHELYTFMDGYSSYNQISIAPKD